MTLLSPNSVLRRLPDFIDLTDRVRTQTLVFATDVMGIAFERSIAVAEAMPRGEFQFAPAVRYQLFGDAWSIVDQLHVIRQLLTDDALNNLGPIATDWHTKYESASLLRNRMDHIHGNAQNLAQRQGSARPLFGGLSVLRVFDLEKLGVEPADYQLVTIGSGISPKGASWSTPPFPAASKYAVYSIFLDAFHRTIDLAAAVRELQGVLMRAEELATAEIDHHVKSTSLQPEALASSLQYLERNDGWVVEGVINPVA